MLNKERFQDELRRIFEAVEDLGLSFIDIKSGDLHRIVGHYPGRDHRMPMCCDVMYQNMTDSDLILEQPPKGKGASLIVRYKLPR